MRQKVRPSEEPPLSAKFRTGQLPTADAFMDSPLSYWEYDIPLLGVRYSLIILGVSKKVRYFLTNCITVIR